MSIAILAQGTLFKIESATSTGTFTTIPEVSKLGCPNQKFDILDVTSHDSSDGVREFIPGLIDGENATAEVNFVPTNGLHQQVRDDALGRTLRNFEIIFPGSGAGSELDFAAYIVGISPQADAGAVLKETITCKVTGVQEWSEA